MTKRLAKEEGIFCGMSSGGAVHAALQLAGTVEKGVIICIICDKGDRYLSSDLFDFPCFKFYSMSVITQKLKLHDKLRHIHEKYRSDLQPIPVRNNAQQRISRLIALLFPVSSDKIFSELDIMELELQLRHLLSPVENVIGSIDETVSTFFSRVPDLFEDLQKGAQGILAFDPAAHSIEEVFSAYPGFYAVAAYRFAHELYLLNIPVLPRLIAEYAHSATCIIGNNVKFTRV